MAEDLPSDFDAIILGTGLPESVIAAALARIGYKVLHLDRNDYYSGYWASFNFESFQEWIKQNSEEESENEETFEGRDREVCLPGFGNAVTNIEVRSYLRNKNNEDVDNISGLNKATELGYDLSGGNTAKDTGVSEDLIPSESEHVTELNYGTAETHENQNTSCDSNTDAQSINEYPTTSNEPSTASKDETCESLKEELNNTSVVSNAEQSDVSEITGSNDNPESGDTLKEDIEKPSEEAPEASNVLNWAQKRKIKNVTKLDRNSTNKDFFEKSRKFNLDLSPKVLFSRGLLVESLITANISHYAEFKVVSRILTYMGGKIEEVPCSRSDVFGSELINVLEKRALMRFMTFCSTFEDSPEQYESFKDKPFVDFLISRKLTANLQHIILNAIAVVPKNTSTLSGLKATQKFLRSLGRYGNTPFLWSLYGAGELPQAFCRMSAVFGGIYCLRKNVKSLVLDDKKNCMAVISEEGQRLNTKWLIMEQSYAPAVFEVETQMKTSRAILITDKSLRPAAREYISLLTLPPSRSSESPVRVIELAPSSMACPESLYVVHFTTETVVNATEDLKSYVEDLFTIPEVNDVTDRENEKPTVLWSIYFNMDSGVSTNTNKLPSNVRLTSLPSAELDFEDALKEAKDIFTSICPNEDFLRAVPNPEDIIWDDIGSNTDTKEEASEQAGDDVVADWW